MPHVIDMTKALVISVSEWWYDQPERHPISKVRLQVGKFTCVEPKQLVSAFSQMRNSFPFMKNTELVISEIPFIAYCQDCDTEYEPEIGLKYSCPECNAPLHEIKSGRELKVERIEWEN